jgi:hypothetical protein
MQRFEICDFVCKKVCIEWERASSGELRYLYQITKITLFMWLAVIFKLLYFITRLLSRAHRVKFKHLWHFYEICRAAIKPVELIQVPRQQ